MFHIEDHVKATERPVPGLFRLVSFNSGFHPAKNTIVRCL